MSNLSLLEESLDQLYGAAPEEFVALRKQLQGELRASGNRPEAVLLGRARRPSASMGAVNQLVRQRPELVEALLDRSDELRIAQAQALGNREAMRTAVRAHRNALDEATDAALDVLGPRANDAFREEIVSVLRAASSQPEMGRELRIGRLVRADDITPGFPDFGGLLPETTESDAPPRRDAKRAARAASSTEDEHARAKAAADEAARVAERAAQANLERARQDEAAADAAVTAARQRVDDLAGQLTNVRNELRDAEATARRARADADRLAASLEHGNP